MIREAIGHKCDLAHTCVRRNGRDGRGGEAEEDGRAPIGPNLETIGRDVDERRTAMCRRARRRWPRSLKAGGGIGIWPRFRTKPQQTAKL